MVENKIEFKEIRINKSYGTAYKRVYYVVENDISKTMDAFWSLSSDERDQVKSLISRMATTVDNYHSPYITYHLKAYEYGEIKPRPHRFFFFQKYGNNYIFFGYYLKKCNSLPDKIYKRFNKDKERYETEFEKFIQRNR